MPTPLSSTTSVTQSLLTGEPRLGPSAGTAVLDGVVHQVVDDLVELVPGGVHQAPLPGLIGQCDVPLRGHQLHHPQHLLEHRQYIHHRGLLHQPAVQPGQLEQVLGDAGQALGLLADVRHEFLGGGRIDVFRLEDGVRQQLDGRQRRLELVGGVGDEAPPGLLRLLQPVGEAVELLGDLPPVSSRPRTTARRP